MQDSSTLIGQALLLLQQLHYIPVHAEDCRRLNNRWLNFERGQAEYIPSLRTNLPREAEDSNYAQLPHSLHSTYLASSRCTPCNPKDFPPVRSHQAPQDLQLGARTFFELNIIKIS
jgi:hypothetical protein